MRALPKIPALLLALPLLLAVRSEAALSAEASLSSGQVMVGESFQLVVRVSSDQKPDDLPWPQVAGLEPFTVTKTTGTSSNSQTTILNGHISRSDSYITDFTYSLTAKRPGTFTLGPIRYTKGGFDQDLGTATVSVVKGEAALTTHSTLSKGRAYVGEQILYTLRIIPKAGVQSINLPQDLQKLIGQKFFFQQLEKEIAPKTVPVDGQPTRVFDVNIGLFPLLTGPIALEGIPVEYRILKQSAARGQSMFDAFDDAFFGGGGGTLVTQTALSSPLRVEALPLPSGAPGGFTGSVGKYSLSAAVDRASAATGDAVTLTVTVRGNGQPKSITKPVLPDLSAFEVYDPEETSASEVEGSVLWTTKTFKYVLIPGREGSYTLDGIAFPYFDPQRGAYAVAKGPAIALRIVPGKGGTAAPSSFVSQHDISQLGSDIRHIKTGSFRLEDGSDVPYRHAGFFFLLAFPPLAFAGLFALRRRKERFDGDAALLRRTRAGSRLRKRLKAAQRAMDAGQGREFYRELSEAVAGFASDKLNQEFRGLTHPEARALLLRRGATADTADAYDALLQRCEFALFAGGAPSAAELGGDLDRGEKLLTRFDKELS